MGANNFDYDNRCIVVDNEDLEFKNYPETIGSYGNSRSYPKEELKISENFELISIFLSYGYYEAACISYTEDENKYIDWYNSHKYTLKGNRRKEGVIEREYKTQLKREIKNVNKLLDQIKKDYGFTEYNCVAIASNGESFYQEIK